MDKAKVIMTRRERENALEALELLEIIEQKLIDRSSTTTIEIETEIVLRIRLCVAFRQRIVKRL